MTHEYRTPAAYVGRPKLGHAPATLTVDDLRSRHGAAALRCNGAVEALRVGDPVLLDGLRLEMRDHRQEPFVHVEIPLAEQVTALSPALLRESAARANAIIDAATEADVLFREQLGGLGRRFVAILASDAELVVVPVDSSDFANPS